MPLWCDYSSGAGDDRGSNLAVEHRQFGGDSSPEELTCSQGNTETVFTVSPDAGNRHPFTYASIQNSEQNNPAAWRQSTIESQQFEGTVGTIPVQLNKYEVSFICVTTSAPQRRRLHRRHRGCDVRKAVDCGVSSGQLTVSSFHCAPDE